MGKLNHFGRGLRLAAVLAGLGFAVGTAQAAQLVTLTRGQSMVVQSAEKRGAWYYLILEGGGELGVPARLVASVEEYEAPPPPANAPAAVAPAAPAPAALAAPQAVQAPPSAEPQGAVASQESGGPGAQAVEPRADAPTPDPNAAVQGQGNDDWRYRVRMSGGPRKGMLNNPYGPGGPGAAGGRLGIGAVKPGTSRIIPPQQQNPQN